MIPDKETQKISVNYLNVKRIIDKEAEDVLGVYLKNKKTKVNLKTALHLPWYVIFEDTTTDNKWRIFDISLGRFVLDSNSYTEVMEWMKSEFNKRITKISVKLCEEAREKIYEYWEKNTDKYPKYTYQLKQGFPKMSMKERKRLRFKQQDLSNKEKPPALFDPDTFLSE
jgi:hypothetical protein